jgi:hypothetical protein
MVGMKELEKQIEVARLAVKLAIEAEEENDYDDAMLSIERSYNEGWLDAIEFAYTILNGHGYNEK